jgi:hypothetical protein
MFRFPVLMGTFQQGMLTPMMLEVLTRSNIAEPIRQALRDRGVEDRGNGVGDK